MRDDADAGAARAHTRARRGDGVSHRIDSFGREGIRRTQSRQIDAFFPLVVKKKKCKFCFFFKLILFSLTILLLKKKSFVSMAEFSSSELKVKTNGKHSWETGLTD